MEKTRINPKKKKQRVIKLKFDSETYDNLIEIAKLSETTLDQTISVLLAVYLVNNGYHNKQPSMNIGLGDK